MRISVGTAGSRHVCVMLDGYPVRNCIFADEDGYVEVHGRPEAGEPRRSVVLSFPGHVRLYWLGSDEDRARFKLVNIPMATAEIAHQMRNGPWHPDIEAQSR